MMSSTRPGVRTRRQILFTVFALAILHIGAVVGLAGSAAAQDRSPLLMEGKRALHQRVLTRPAARLVSAPADSAAGDEVTPFSVLFVYDRLKVGDHQWVEVGASSRGVVDGWMRADQVIDWKQSMVVAFSNPAGRNRLPLFEDREFVSGLLQAEDAVKRNDLIISQLVLDNVPPDVPAISIEPANYVDFSKNFYLLPILDAEEIYFVDGFSAKLLKIASVVAEEGGGANSASTESQAEAATESNREAQAVTGNSGGPGPKVGIAFVIDATTSMGPYIDRTRAAVRQIYDSIEQAGYLDRVSFGLVGYRDNTDAAPGLEFVSQVFADLSVGDDPSKFLELSEALSPADVSSPDFIEDAFAGVLQAINGLDWQGFDNRFIILITDAGPRLAADPLAKTGLNADGVRQLALDKGIAIFAMHLLTPEGRRNHASAEAQLMSLADHPKGNLYFAVPGGNAERLGRVVRQVATQLEEQVRLADQNATEEDYVAAAEAQPADDEEMARLRRNAARVGYAMKLAYAGRTEGTRAPSIFEAWIADRDVSSPEAPALEVRLLLTKNQLSDLQETLKIIIEAGEKGILSPVDFFSEIQSAVAVLSRTPDQLRRTNFGDLAESGLLGEYLVGLPYRSKVMNVTEDLWLSWSIGEQQEFLDELDAKNKLYEEYHDDVDRWILLAEGGNAGDAVYPVPLDSLP